MPASSASTTPKLSLVIPVYNEEKLLKAFCENLFALSFNRPVEYIFVEDGSKDRSWDVLESFRNHPGVVLFRQPHNQGKGAALHKGFELATGDIVAVQDADFEYDPNDLPLLVDTIAQDKADIVYGSRFKAQTPQVHRTVHHLGNKVLTLISNLLSGLYLTDMETCYKVFKAEIIKGIPLECQRFGFEPEITAKIARLKVRVHEYPISYYPRTYAAGKKIGWKDGFAALWFMLKFNVLQSFLPTSATASAPCGLPDKYIAHERQWL